MGKRETCQKGKENKRLLKESKQKVYKYNVTFTYLCIYMEAHLCMQKENFKIS